MMNTTIDNPAIDLIVLLVSFAVIMVVYFLPGIVGEYRKLTTKNSISVLNLLFGWTVIGWFVLLFVASLSGNTIKNKEFKQ